MSNHNPKNGSTITRTAGGLDFTAKAVKDGGAKCPNRCGCNRVFRTRFGKPDQNHNSGQKKANIII
jgi:hypothetical protein